jgi:hypothetical protein
MDTTVYSHGLIPYRLQHEHGGLANLWEESSTGNIQRTLDTFLWRQVFEK